MPTTTSDPELKAIQSMITALESLDEEARRRVMSYVSQRLNLSLDSELKPVRTEPVSTSEIIGSTTETSTSHRMIDIRSLKEQKNPSSANEMATLVAFYLAELAPIDERKSSIDKDDIEKYFKQAGYPLPKAVRQTLPNAAKSGYFDITGGGRYRLNPVGYNLVVHGLPAKHPNK